MRHQNNEAETDKYRNYIVLIEAHALTRSASAVCHSATWIAIRIRSCADCAPIDHRDGRLTMHNVVIGE